MAAIALLALLLAAGPQPTDGPALPIAMLREARLAKTTVSMAWRNGLYEVSFEYRSDKTVPELASLLAKDSFQPKIQGVPNDAGYQVSRSKNGISQSVYMSRSIPRGGRIYKGNDSGVKPVTTIFIQEAANGATPARWYKGAISPKPPVPLIDVPFLSGVTCDAVSLQSFDQLMSSRGVDIPGTDAAVFAARINRPPPEVRAALDAWAIQNGYTKTIMQSYFKPGVKLFEIYFTPSRKESRCTVTFYTTDRKVTHPISWEKF